MRLHPLGKPTIKPTIRKLSKIEPRILKIWLLHTFNFLGREIRLRWLEHRFSSTFIPYWYFDMLMLPIFFSRQNNNGIEQPFNETGEQALGLCKLQLQVDDERSLNFNLHACLIGLWLKNEYMAHFLSSNSDQHVKIQLFAKLKKPLEVDS